MLLCTLCFTGRAQNKPVVKNLSYFLDKALEINPSTKDYKNQVLMNGIDKAKLKAGYRPQVNASSTGLYAPVIRGVGYDETLSNGHTLDALLTLNYGLMNKALKNNQEHGLDLQADSIQYAAKISALDLRKAITDQYIAAFASQEQVDFNQSVCELLKKEEALLKELTRANTYKQTEYLTFLVTLKQQQLQLRQAELQYQNDYATLNYLTGIQDTTTSSLMAPVLSFSEPGPLKFFGAKFKLDSLRLINEQEAVGINYRPKASVYVNGGYNSSFILQPYKNFGTSVGFTVSVPIYDGHQKKMQYDRLNLQAETNLLYQDFFYRQQKQQIDLLKQQLAATTGLFTEIEDQIRYAKHLVDVDSKLMRTGEVRIADFVIAINNYMSAQNLLKQTNINRLKLISQLNYWNR